MKIAVKKNCNCLKGLCFLAQDMAQAEANYREACAEVKSRRVSVLIELEEKRVFKKKDWLESLGLDTVANICCQNKS